MLNRQDAKAPRTAIQSTLLLLIPWRPGALAVYFGGVLAAAEDCLGLAAALVLQARLPFAKLAGEFAHDQVDSGVEVLAFFVGEDVRAGDGDVHLDPKTVLGLGRFIVNEDDVRRDNLAGEFLQMFDLLRAMPMDRGCETKVAGTEVDLHSVR